MREHYTSVPRKMHRTAIRADYLGCPWLGLETAPDLHDHARFPVTAP